MVLGYRFVGEDHRFLEAGRRYVEAGHRSVVVGCKVGVALVDVAEIGLVSENKGLSIINLVAV